MKEITDFDEWYKKLNKSDKLDCLKFVWELMRTPYTEYHYSLITNKNTNKQFMEELWSKFDEHEDAEAFLLNKLEHDKDREHHGNILFCLGKIIDLRHGKEKSKVIEHVKNNINNPNENVRENAIIVLGWLGGNKDIKSLGNILLNDVHNEMQSLGGILIYANIVSEKA